MLQQPFRSQQSKKNHISLVAVISTFFLFKNLPFYRPAATYFTLEWKFHNFDSIH